MEEQPSLFDVPAPAPSQPAPKLTPGEALRQRQAEKLLRGLHPLTRDGRPPILLHRDAAPAADQSAEGLRCRDCRFRQQLIREGGKAFPKCVLPDKWGEPSRATHGTASDVRARWPACQDYEPNPA